MTDMKFQTGLSFASAYMKVMSGRSENSCVLVPCKILLVHFENKYGREKKHGKTIIIDKYIKYITTCRFLHNQYYLQIGYVID